MIISAKEYEPQLRVEIKPYCYGGNVLLKVEETYLDINDKILWRPSANTTILIKHFGYILKQAQTNENGTLKHTFPIANIYGIKLLKEDYETFAINEILLRSCLLSPYTPPEQEPYIHIPPVINPPEPGTLDWVRVVMLW